MAVKVEQVVSPRVDLVVECSELVVVVARAYLMVGMAAARVLAILQAMVQVGEVARTQEVERLNSGVPEDRVLTRGLLLEGEVPGGAQTNRPARSPR